MRYILRQLPELALSENREWTSALRRTLAGLAKGVIQTTAEIIRSLPIMVTATS
jgi:hypothetical protein